MLVLNILNWTQLLILFYFLCLPSYFPRLSALSLHSPLLLPLHCQPDVRLRWTPSSGRSEVGRRTPLQSDRPLTRLSAGLKPLHELVSCHQQRCKLMGYDISAMDGQTHTHTHAHTHTLGGIQAYTENKQHLDNFSKGLHTQGYLWHLWRYWTE